MPDAISLSEDPHARPNLNKEVTAIAWNTWSITVYLPDLGKDFTVTSFNTGNTIRQNAQDSRVTLGPGVYLLSTKGSTISWKPTDKWRNLKLGEFVAPPPTKNVHLVQEALEEVSEKLPLLIKADVVAPQAADRVEMLISIPDGDRIRRNVLPLSGTGPYSWSLAVPDSFLNMPGFLRYQLRVVTGARTKTNPVDVDPTTPVREFNIASQTYATRIVPGGAPVCLFDVATDQERIMRPHRRFPLIYKPSSIPGKSGAVMDAGNISYMGFFFGDKVAGRKADMVSKKTIVLRGYALSITPVTLWVSIQLKDGSEWGETVSIRADKQSYELPLKGFRQILLTGPGERGPIKIKPYPEGSNNGHAFKIEEAEILKLTVIRSPGDPKAVVEFVTLQ